MPSEAATVAVAVREPVAVMLTNAQIQMIANTEFVPKSYRGNVPSIMACIATGRALGIPDMSALHEIAIIDGKPSKSSALCQLLVRRQGHSIRITLSADATRADAYGKRRDTGDPGHSYFTLDMAKRAGLLGKKNWQQYPEAMLKARAVTQLCRDLFSDCLAGASYTPEELGSEEWIADEVIDEPQEKFDSGELPLTEDEANLAPPVSTDTVGPLDLLIATYGREAVAKAGSELFPGRSARALSPDELEQITDRLGEPPF